MRPALGPEIFVHFLKNSSFFGSLEKISRLLDNNQGNYHHRLFKQFCPLYPKPVQWRPTKFSQGGGKNLGARAIFLFPPERILKM